MSNQFHFPTFYFKPIKLGVAVKKLKEKYQHGIDVPENIMSRKLPDLLNRIRELPNNDDVIILFANGLNNFELTILTSAYPYETENEQTTKKIIKILSHRYNSLIGRRFWGHFQHRIKDENIYLILNTTFTKEDNSFLGLDDVVRQNYQTVFRTTDSERVLYQLAAFIGRENQRVDDSFHKYRVNNDSILANDLWIRMLELFLNETNFVEVQGEAIIVEKLKNIKLDRYKTIIQLYLGSIDYKEFNKIIMLQVIERLKDPRKDMKYWEDIPNDIVQKVKMYLFENELHEFFGKDHDNERFNYWSKYVRYVDRLKLIENPPIIAMYINNFVVVEFGEVNNAAYFYKRNGFDKFLAYKMKENIKADDLKNRYANYYIHRLSHNRYWQSTFDRYMSDYLKGNFNYIY